MLTKSATRRLLVALLTVTAAITGLCYPLSDATYWWHDSSQYSRVIVNARDGIEMRPKQWFAQDKLITDYTIANADVVGRDKAAQEYKATRDLLRSYGLAVGTYISGTIVIPESKETHWPWSAVPLEWMPASSQYNGNWPGMDYRKIIDVTDPATRHAFQQGIKRLWEQTPAPVRFIDNAGIHRSAGKSQPWSSYCANIEEIRKIGESMGSLQIFNLSLHVGEMSDEETSQLIKAVGKGGILLEMPWHENIRKNPAATERARLRYRELLDAGMGIIMATPGTEPPQELVNWVRTWRKPTDHLYFAGVFWKAPDAKLYGAGALQ
jgi:hypothetical protein